MPAQATNEFPPGFLWGCATAAYQVEGHNANDWWRWEQVPGRIFQDQRAGAACEWIGGRYAEDFERAAWMGNNAGRISVEWSRIEPEPGQFDAWALDFYRSMLADMRKRGLTPMVTLHHFTNPLWVADRDGWLWGEIPARFAQFARKVVEALGDLCTLWCTINEPMVYAVKGYMEGVWPPGKRSRSAAARVAANMLRAHSAAYAAIKNTQPHAQVGLAQHVVGIRPARQTPWHTLASRAIHRFFNQAFLEAFNTGILKVSGAAPTHVPGAKGTLDWIGLQYYQEFRAGFSLRTPHSLFITQRKPGDMPVGPHTWGGLNPGALFKHVRWLYELLERPIYITEAGVPDPDDSIRPAYLAETVRSAWQAINYNYPVRGLFVWSLLDNFEWAEGYDPRYRFGLYEVDFKTQARTARGSAHLYRAICKANGISSQTVAQFAPAALEELFPGSPGQQEVHLKPRPTA